MPTGQNAENRLHFFSGIPNTPASTWNDLPSTDLNLGGYVVEYDPSSVVFNTSGLYYQPEESLDPLAGTSAFGLWQLEIWDNRVGATNNASLISWNLDFQFADRTPVPADLGGGSPQTNFIAPGGLAWFQINVPTNADFATNTLFFATGPLGLWCSTISPPTIT